jgi:23S rRNA (uracil1939-C5)-methyltransferase
MMSGDHRLTLRRHVLAFFQGNRFLLSPLVDRVVQQAGREDAVVDLFAGVGLFSIAAAARGARVVAVEGDRVSGEDLENNARSCGGAVETVRQSVEAFTARSRSAPDVVIVDPPRTGMSKEAVAGVIALRARTLIYVSCDVATFARDTRRLLDAGYAVESLTGLDLFPNTPHVETVAVFRR